jgi:hypothetical protein
MFSSGVQIINLIKFCLKCIFIILSDIGIRISMHLLFLFYNMQSQTLVLHIVHFSHSLSFATFLLTAAKLGLILRSGADQGRKTYV